MKNKAILLSLFLLLFRQLLIGQALENNKYKLNIDPISFNKKLDTLFSQFNSKTSPGFAITIIQNGNVLLKKNYGMANIEFKVPFTHNSVATIPYSEGREFISVATALLEQDGKLTLEDKVRNYFPKLPDWSNAVTIQDLLNHSSGFCDEWATLVLTQAEMNNRIDVSQFLNFLYKQPDPQVEPGKGYMYCNSDFGLLRLILEKASGEKLHDYMERKIFRPLKMTASKMRKDKEEVIPNHAFSYDHKGEGLYKIWLRDKTSPGGNYQILTTADDLEKWANACTDKSSFIYKAFIRLKEHARPIPVLTGVNYVYGYKEKKIGDYLLTTHEGVSGYSYLSQVPAAGLTIICIGNSHEPYSDVILTLADYLLYNENTTRQPFRKFPTTPIKIDKEKLQQFGGRYHWMESSFNSNRLKKAYTEFRIINDSLNWVYAQDDIFPVVPVGEGIFKDPGFPLWLVFEQTRPDSAMQLTIHVQTIKPQIIVCTKDTVTSKFFSKEMLQKLTGKYYSQHLDFYWTIEMDNQGRLVVKRPTVADKYLEPQPDGEFMMKVQYHTDDESAVLIKFYFNQSGEPIYFDVRHPRLMHCRFDKQ